MKINPLRILPCGIDFDQENAPDKVNSYRRILPQVIFPFEINHIHLNLFIRFEM